MNQTGFWKKLSSGSTFDSINSIDIYDALLKVPNDHEQLKVSSFFTEIDQSIDLHQRELDALKKLKKSTLQKMFPTQGKNRPLIRFAGFTDAWEQRKLSSICSMHARIGWQNLRTSEFLDSGDYYLITGTDFSDGKILLDSCHYVAKERYDQDRNIQVKNKSILITKDGTLGKVAYVEGLDKPATLNAGVFNVVISNNDVDEKYLFQYLKSPFLMDYVAQKATGGTIKHLNQTILVDFPVAMPKLAEQRKIGEFFMKLDGHVALHQRELEMLKNMKKALLQKMFC
jgi:Restriction endonuclease S subunits